MKRGQEDTTSSEEDIKGYYSQEDDTRGYYVTRREQ
jgi:hypothetical protein